MEIIVKPRSAKYRIIVRDEETSNSQSFGIYSTGYELVEIKEIIQTYLEGLEKE